MIEYYSELKDFVQVVQPDFKFLVIGDSIANGTSNGTVSAQPNNLKEWDGTLVNSVNDVANANTGTWMPKLADKLKELTNRSVIVSADGSGGSEFHPYLDNNNWSTSGNLYANMKIKADDLIQSQGNIDGIIMILGINDARGNNAINDIKNSAISLINRLNTDFNTPKIFMVQIGRTESGVTQRVLDVRDIISNNTDGLVETYPNVYLSASLADFPDTDFYDNLHLTQPANNTLGENLAISINSIIT